MQAAAACQRANQTTVIAYENSEAAPEQCEGRDEAPDVRAASRHMVRAQRQEDRYPANPFMQPSVRAEEFRGVTVCSSPLAEDFLLIFPAATFLLLAALTVVLL
jgi:hypothetical protein